MTKPAKTDLLFLEPGEVATQKQIDEWKQQHGDVYAIHEEVFNDLISEDDALDNDILRDELDVPSSLVAYVKKPTRKILQFAAKRVEAEKADSIRFTQLVIRNVWVAGHKEFLEDDALLMSLGAKLEELIGIKALEIKKL